MAIKFNIATPCISIVDFMNYSHTPLQSFYGYCLHTSEVYIEEMGYEITYLYIMHCIVDEYHLTIQNLNPGTISKLH
jgi:hypothetical protein